MTSPAPVLPRATVVICVYTEKRWDDIVAAVGSVLDQDVRAAEVLVVVDHNPALLERARGVFGEGVRVLPNAHRQGLSGARNTAVAAAGLRITEVPSVERQRIFGETNLRTFADGARVLRTLIAEHRRARTR